ncbi:MAG: glutathione S-transferase family protein [Rhizobacter sp.]
MDTVKLSAFRWVPPVAQGLVRDLRVRWALEEAGLPYDERLIGFEDQNAEWYRKLQPFGQVPAIESDGSVLFESGAIVMDIAETAEALMPPGRHGRALVRTWVFAALNTVEPPILMLSLVDRQPATSREGLRALRDTVMERVQSRLDSLAAFLGGREHLVADRFTAADLLMTTVLRILRDTDVLGKTPALDAYRRRGESRPAFQKALAAQLKTFATHAPPGA